MDCYTCELSARRRAGNAPLWDNVYQTELWDVAHSYNTALPGWMVLIVRRHIEAVGELTAVESAELGDLIRRVSIALTAVTGCAKTYVVQFAEAADHPHVHFHIIPRMADQPDAWRGAGIFKALGVDEDVRVDEAAMNAIAREMRAILENGESVLSPHPVPPML